MTKRWLRAGAGSLLAAAALATAGAALADWPTTRHDPRRTGVSSAASNIKTPGVYWRSPLGGAPGAVYLGDVNQDGTQDVLYIGAGGELFLSGPDGTILWRTGQHAYQGLVGVADVDHDGQLDIVVTSSTHASIVNGKTGKIEWEEPAGELGTIDQVRLADVDGDGKLDLWLDTCGCCAVETGSPGVIYSFAGGFGAPTTLGPPPNLSHCSSTSNTVVDLIGDGHLEMVAMSDTAATAFRADGSTLATSAPLPSRAFRAQCQPANVDGNPGDELVCFTNAVYGGGGERGLFAIGYHPTKTPALELLWNVQVSDPATGDAQAPTTLVVDLDGDGKPEAIVSGQQGGAYTTSVLDAATGTVLTTTAGIAVSDVPSVATGQRWLLVANATTVSAMAFTRTPPALAQQWQVPGGSVAQRDWTRALVSSFATALVTPDLNGDGRPDLLLTSTTEPYVLSGYDTSTGMPSSVGKYALDTGVSMSSVGASNFKGTASLFVGRNDGFVALLSGGLAPTNLTQEGTSTLPGMYVGGYYTGQDAYYGFGRLPIAAKMSPADTAQALLVVDSRGDLVRIDPSAASISAPAKPTWRLADLERRRDPDVGHRPRGPRRVPAAPPRHQPPAVHGLRGRHRREGARQPEHPPGARVGRAPRRLRRRRVGELRLHRRRHRGDGRAHGDERRRPAGVAEAPPGRLRDGAHLHRRLGRRRRRRRRDGPPGRPRVLRQGRSGARRRGRSAPLLHPHPRAHPGHCAARHGAPGRVPPRAGPRPRPQVPLGERRSSAGLPLPARSPPVSSAPVLVEGSWSVTLPQLTLTQVAGASPGSTTSIVLASGASYPDVATATAAKATIGHLTDVAVSTNLDGTGKGPTALVGSTDGYLYALDACTGALRWSVLFGYPVSSPILADTDGDGNDEIIVSVADGYLYGLKNEALPQPAYVWDIDPPHGITNMDVDSIDTVSTLYATWAPVTGAATYEVTVASIDGTYVTSPSWIDVGAVTTASIPNLALTDGAKYFVGVRAVSPEGKSTDTSSNGVVVHLPATPDGGHGRHRRHRAAPQAPGARAARSTGGDVAPSGGCGCSVPPAPATSPASPGSSRRSRRGPSGGAGGRESRFELPSGDPRQGAVEGCAGARPW